MLQQKSYQAKQSGPHFFEPKGPNAPKWYVIDAKDQVVGRIATVIARVIIGKHKTTFTKHADTGDFLIVLNADKVVFTRNKWNGKLYRDHSGYVGGIKDQDCKRDACKSSRRDFAPRSLGNDEQIELSSPSDEEIENLYNCRASSCGSEPTTASAGVVRRTRNDSA